MKDISRRLSRYRLSRYGSPDSLLHRMRWVWVVLAVWGLWAGLLSDHSYYRLWRLSKEEQRAVDQLERTRHDAAELNTDITDPATRRRRAEALLRGRGMARPGEIVYRIRETPSDSLRGER